MPPRRFKRDYSRGGCRECKRRKIKCNEAKPHCSECTRLGKDCSYPAIGERVIRGSKKDIDEKKEPSPIEESREKRMWTVQMYMGPDQPKKKLKWDKVSSVTSPEEAQLNEENLNREHGNIVQSVLDEAHEGTNVLQNYQYEEPMNSGNESKEISNLQDFVPPPSLLSGDVYSNDDLNLLAADLNNIVNDIMFSSNMAQPGDYQFDFFNPELETSPYLDDIPKNIPYDYIKLKTEDERRYMTQFYEDFASQILPFGADYKDGGSLYSNPFRDVIMKYAARETYLLAAVLSQGARLASELQHDDKSRQRDMDNCGNYLSTCLKLLGPALSRNQEKQVKGDLTSNIESILVTVLLLASSSASNERQSWRPHLKGAKDIIIKATSSKIRSSPTLIVCKLWFADFEILAGLSSELGGTLRTREEMDVVLNFDDPYEQSVLREFGLIQDDGFCIVMGYHIDCLEYFKEISDFLRRKRNNPEEVPDPLQCAKLIGGFHSQYNKTFATIETRPDGQTAHGLLCDMVHKSNGKLEMISWSDISQQAYSLAGLVTVFTRMLEIPVNSPQVKGLVARLVFLVKVFENSISQGNMRFPFAFSMIQWPMSIAGFACTETSEHSVTENFFRLCYRTGSYSANLTLERIKKVWELRVAGKSVDNVDDGVNVDRITY
ncbi:Lysine biosynthesis regulatory protein LYS14 [Candida parapsilosis]|nr:Lysine biosynthesis regulatory protein LYS14 [Candida parapsilosis]